MNEIAMPWSTFIPMLLVQFVVQVAAVVVGLVIWSRFLSPRR